MLLVFDWDHIESVVCIWQYSDFHNIDSSYPGTRNASPSVYVVFDFSHQCHNFLYTGLLSFILFVGMVNRIDSLISLSDFSLFLRRKASDFRVLP